MTKKTKRARIYLDYASLTPVDRRVLNDMVGYYSPEYANPSSIYREGVMAGKALEEARKSVAGFIHARPDEIVFTGGGTEANNLAIEGVLKAARKRVGAGGVSGPARPHLIISNIEHSSVMEAAGAVEAAGCEVTRLPVNENGLVEPEKLEKALKPNTALVSVMTVNNEIGIVQPIREIARIIGRWRKREGKERASVSKGRDPLYSFPLTAPLFHTDAVQAALYEDLDVEKSGVDLMTLDGSKVYGPRGAGALFIRRAAIAGGLMEPLIAGGGQERGLRPGTENMPAIMGFAAALESAKTEREREAVRIGRLKADFWAGLVGMRPDAAVNPGKTGETGPMPGLPSGDGESPNRLSPHILNVSIPGIDNEFFVLRLDAAGVACSTKSSCLRGEDDSYVLKAIGADSRSSIRFSFGRFTKAADVKAVLSAVRSILADAGSVSVLAKKRRV